MSASKPTNDPAVKRVWIFDINKRVYRKAEDGRSVGGPIWREHWREHVIVGETSRSWVTRSGCKVPKKGGRGIAFSEEDIDRAAYIHDNGHRIAAAVGRIRDYDLLRKVAELIGYEAGQ